MGIRGYSHETKNNSQLLQHHISTESTASSACSSELDNTSNMIMNCSKRSNNSSLIEEISSSSSSPATPEYSVSVVDETESAPRHLMVKINLPGVARIQDCCLDISDVRMYQIDYEYCGACLPLTLGPSDFCFVFLLIQFSKYMLDVGLLIMLNLMYQTKDHELQCINNEWDYVLVNV